MRVGRGALGDDQRLRDLPVGPALGDEGGDFPFARGQGHRTDLPTPSDAVSCRSISPNRGGWGS
jgi:hypothetical protein